MSGLRLESELVFSITITGADHGPHGDDDHDMAVGFVSGVALSWHASSLAGVTPFLQKHSLRPVLGT
jgi:hypothetical protein